MGLDTTHDCWHGPYSRFHRWRCEVAKAAGFPLDLTEGFYEATGAFKTPIDESMRPWLPIRWSALRPDVLYILLNHSDCDGDIAWEHCKPLADRLEELLPELPEGDYAPLSARGRAMQFIAGLRSAHEAQENVEFR